MKVRIDKTEWQPVEELAIYYGISQKEFLRRCPYLATLTLVGGLSPAEGVSQRVWVKASETEYHARLIEHTATRPHLGERTIPSSCRLRMTVENFLKKQ